jgi:hypothetical protein
MTVACPIETDSSSLGHDDGDRDGYEGDLTSRSDRQTDIEQFMRRHR